MANTIRSTTKLALWRCGAVALWRPGVIGLAILLGCWLLGCGRPPQMGGDEEVFSSVDALFTAITARNEKLLGQCEQRLHTLRAARKLPDEASDYLDAVIRKARDGRWQSAAETLYDFMTAQRRDGAENHSKKKDKGRSNSGRK